jgi:hypothetical protein
MLHFTLTFIQSTWRLLFPRLLSRRPDYTPEEVRDRLRADASNGDPRTAAVHAVAARTGIWSNLLPDKEAIELGRASARLASVVYWHAQGVSPHEIGRRLSPFGGTWDADRALWVATALIAHVLNTNILERL